MAVSEITTEIIDTTNRKSSYTFKKLDWYSSQL